MKESVRVHEAVPSWEGPLSIHVLCPVLSKKGASMFVLTKVYRWHGKLVQFAIYVPGPKPYSQEKVA